MMLTHEPQQEEKYLYTTCSRGFLSWKGYCDYWGCGCYERLDQFHTEAFLYYMEDRCRDT